MYSNPLPAYAYRAAALLRRARPPEPRVRRGDGGSAVVRLREALVRTKAEANRAKLVVFMDSTVDDGVIILNGF